MSIEIKVNVFGTYDIWDKNDLVCHSLKKEEVGEALHKWLCNSKEVKKMKIDVYSLLPDKVKDYIAEEISETLSENGYDNSIVIWDILCELPDEVY